MENNNKDMHNKILTMFANTIQAKDGKPVMMDTVDCMTHRLSGDTNTQKRCCGCKGELQCTKMTILLMLDVFSRTGQIAMFGITSGFTVMEYMVDVARAKDLDALNAVLPIALLSKIIQDK
jgi:hypothetical protein